MLPGKVLCPRATWDYWGDDDDFPMRGRVTIARDEFNEAIDAFSAYLQKMHEQLTEP
jgi:hypothetical protein